MQGHTDSVTGIRLSSDGSYLLSNGMDNTGWTPPSILVCCHASLARVILKRFLFLCLYVDPVCNLVSANASLARTTEARVAYLFVHMFPFCACFLRGSVVYASLARITFCVFFLCASVSYIY